MRRQDKIDMILDFLIYGTIGAIILAAFMILAGCSSEKKCLTECEFDKYGIPSCADVCEEE